MEITFHNKDGSWPNHEFSFKQHSIEQLLLRKRLQLLDARIPFIEGATNNALKEGNSGRQEIYPDVPIKKM